MIIVDKARCPQDHACPAARACPVGALIQDGFKAPAVDTDKCTECQKCVRVCPLGALKYTN